MGHRIAKTISKKNKNRGFILLDYKLTTNLQCSQDGTGIRIDIQVNEVKLEVQK